MAVTVSFPKQKAPLPSSQLGINSHLPQLSTKKTLHNELNNKTNGSINADAMHANNAVLPRVSRETSNGINFLAMAEKARQSYLQKKAKGKTDAQKLLNQKNPTSQSTQIVTSTKSTASNNVVLQGLMRETSLDIQSAKNMIHEINIGNQTASTLIDVKHCKSENAVDLTNVGNASTKSTTNNFQRQLSQNDSSDYYNASEMPRFSPNVPFRSKLAIPFITNHVSPSSLHSSTDHYSYLRNHTSSDIHSLDDGFTSEDTFSTDTATDAAYLTPLSLPYSHDSFTNHRLMNSDLVDFKNGLKVPYLNPPPGFEDDIKDGNVLNILPPPLEFIL
jgi:hypothetical protein